MTNAMIKASVAAVVMVVSTLAVAEADAGCRLENVEVVRHKVAPGCWLAGVSGRVVDPSKRALVDISGDVFSCGEVEVNQWREVRREGMALCEALEEDEFPMDLSSGIEVLSVSRAAVSVDFVESGYTGGAHPFAVIERRTLDRRTGAAMGLLEVLGDGGTAALARARVKFEADPERASLYDFDPRSFAIFPQGDGVRVAFAFTHAIEVARGTTLDVEIALPAGVAPLPRDATATRAM